MLSGLLHGFGLLRFGSAWLEAYEKDFSRLHVLLCKNESFDIVDKFRNFTTGGCGPYR
jgi:hypothetical protein